MQPDYREKLYLTASICRGLAGMESAFVLASIMVLYFGSRKKTPLKTYHSFAYYKVVLAQCKGFLSFFSFSNSTTSRLRSSKILEMVTVRPADPNWPKRYSVPYIVLLNNKAGVAEMLFGGPMFSGILATQTVAVHQSACGTWWLITFASLVFCLLLIY